MNIITRADIKKFIKLMKAGITEGKQKEMKIYSSASNYDGTNVPKEWFCNIEFSFRLAPEIIDAIVEEESVDDEIKDMLKNL